MYGMSGVIALGYSFINLGHLCTFGILSLPTYERVQQGSYQPHWVMLVGGYAKVESTRIRECHCHCHCSMLIITIEALQQILGEK